MKIITHILQLKSEFSSLKYMSKVQKANISIKMQQVIHTMTVEREAIIHVKCTLLA